MSQESRRHARPRKPAARVAAKRTEELMNHPSFKYTLVHQQMRGI
jgi:hypothetical protein